MSVSAHLQSIDVALGEVVAGGQTIGTVGDSGTLEGTRLYFEIRRDGRPEQPLEWLRPPPGC